MYPNFEESGGKSLNNNGKILGYPKALINLRGENKLIIHVCT